VGPGFSVNDHAAGLSAAVAVLAALEARERTGEGQHVDISQMETGAYLIGPAVLDDLTNGRVTEPQGNVDPFGHLAPNECYPTSDGGWLAVTCRDDRDWERLVGATGIAVPEGLASVEGRLASLDEVNRVVAAWAATVTADAGQQLLQGAGVPAGRIQNGADLMADPQLLARDMWRTCDHAVFGERPYDRFPAIWSGMTLEPYLPSPAFIGEHNFDVYTEVAGLDADEVGEGMATGLFE
jgi:crotonobetainyl-CoA:carnitine CoA-transferase CaiB-like acyl-CoA transferase